LVGYIQEGLLDRFMVLVGEIRQREISSATLFEKAKASDIESSQFESLLKALFDCSAIGNKWRTPSGSSRYEFRFRNRNAIFDKSKTIVLHKGMWKALNLV
jgi:hypothetical protein